MKIHMAGLYQRREDLGSSKVIIKLTEEFSKMGFDASNFFISDIKFKPKRAAWGYLYFPFFMAYNTFNGKYNVVDISSGDGCLIPFLRRLPFLKSKIGSVKYVYRNHGSEHLESLLVKKYWNSGKQSLANKVAFGIVRLKEVELATKYSDAIVVSNSWERDFLLDRFSIKPNKVRIIPLGIDEEFFISRDDLEKKIERMLKNIETAELGFLFVGSWMERKGISKLIDFWKKAKEEFPKSTLTIVSCDEPAKVHKEEFGSDSRVRIFPKVDKEKLIEFYYRSDIFIFPSKYEGFGLVIGEAIASGNLVITNTERVGICLDWLKKDKHYLEIGSKCDLLSVVTEAINNPNHVVKIIQDSFDHIAKFKWRDTAVKTYELYKDPLSR